MKVSLRRARELGIGAAIFAIFALAVGIAGAQRTDAQPRDPDWRQEMREMHDQWVQALASNLGLPADRVQQALQQTQEQMRPQMGERVREHRERMRERMRERFEERGEAPLGMRPGGGPMMGQLPLLRVAADVLGMEPVALRQELGSGKTLAQVGQEHGLSADQLTDRIVARAAEMQQQGLRDRVRAMIDQPWRGPMSGPPPGRGL